MCNLFMLMTCFGKTEPLSHALISGAASIVAELQASGYAHFWCSCELPLHQCVGLPISVQLCKSAATLSCQHWFHSQPGKSAASIFISDSSPLLQAYWESLSFLFQIGFLKCMSCPLTWDIGALCQFGSEKLCAAFTNMSLLARVWSISCHIFSCLRMVV